MSRYNDWLNAHAGISKFVRDNVNDIDFNEHNFKMENRIINRYCMEKKINGSFSQKILQIDADFQLFRKYIMSCKNKNTQKQN